MSLVKDDSSYIMEPYSILSYDSRKEDGNLPNIKIGKKCSIAANCTFILSHHLMDRFSSSPSLHSLFGHNMGSTSSYSKGDIVIKNDVWIGANCTILDNITIGNGAVIAAGSVVVKNVPPYGIVCGNPAKVKKYRFSPELIEQIENTQFWELEMHEIDMFDIFTNNIEDLLVQINDYMENRPPNMTVCDESSDCMEEPVVNQTACTE